MKFRQFRYFAIILCFEYLLLSSLTWADNITRNGNHVDPIRSPQLSNAIQKGYDLVEKSKLLQGCMREILRDESNLCAQFDPVYRSRAVKAKIKATHKRISHLLPKSGIDLAPYTILGALEAEESKINDVLKVVGEGPVGSIERCTGVLSTACLTLRSTCQGDWKCYGDGTCACYTCHKGGIPGSCGI